jgi:hypothetical protein
LRIEILVRIEISLLVDQDKCKFLEKQKNGVSNFLANTLYTHNQTDQMTYLQAIKAAKGLTAAGGSVFSSLLIWCFATASSPSTKSKK